MVELIWAGAILTIIGFLIPISIYFFRNIMKYGYKKLFFNLERVLKYSWLGGLLVFLLGIILIIIGIVA